MKRLSEPPLEASAMSLSSIKLKSHIMARVSQMMQLLAVYVCSWHVHDNKYLRNLSIVHKKKKK